MGAVGGGENAGRFRKEKSQIQKIISEKIPEINHSNHQCHTQTLKTAQFQPETVQNTKISLKLIPYPRPKLLIFGLNLCSFRLKSTKITALTSAIPHRTLPLRDGHLKMPSAFDSRADVYDLGRKIRRNQPVHCGISCCTLSKYTINAASGLGTGDMIPPTSNGTVSPRSSSPNSGISWPSNGARV
jgi:hypothetical protein